MADDRLLPFALPAIKPKKVIAAFDGGRLPSNGGVTLLALAEKRASLPKICQPTQLLPWFMIFGLLDHLDGEPGEFVSRNVSRTTRALPSLKFLLELSARD